MKIYGNNLKRLGDIAFALCTIIILSPIILLTAIAIYIEDGSPAIFRQKRVGLNGREFTIFKFRSMPNGTGDVSSRDAKKLEITKVGRFIRRTNLDELPQLFNILCGTMSLIGPRPALASQIELVKSRTEAGVYDIRPGLTGLAQVNSYENMPEGEKVKWDAKYRNELSFLMDLKIVLRTFGYVLKPPPAY